ncbi:MAG TPA: hypothetical protein VK590_10170 [Saprospiraceae bacterium]|nr:hypothetical protein [Saprospiraceae bacterium]
MKHPVIHIKIDKPMPASIRQVLDEKKERGALYAKGDIKTIREMDKKKNVSALSNKR